MIGSDSSVGVHNLFGTYVVLQIGAKRKQIVKLEISKKDIKRKLVEFFLTLMRSNEKRPKKHGIPPRYVKHAVLTPMILK